MTATPTNPTLDLPATVAALLERQRDLFRQLLDLAAQARALADQDDAQVLWPLLSRRAGMLKQIDQVQAQLGPCRARWADESGAVTAEQRRRIDAATRDIERLRRAVLAIDAEVGRRLEKARDRLAGELRRAAEAGRLITAYRQAGPVESRFTDQRG